MERASSQDEAFADDRSIPGFGAAELVPFDREALLRPGGEQRVRSISCSTREAVFAVENPAPQVACRPVKLVDVARQTDHCAEIIGIRKDRIPQAGADEQGA